MTLLENVTRSLREGSEANLSRTLDGLLARQPESVPDWRDLLVSIAPIYDCATRIGVNQIALFDAATRGRQGEMAEVVRKFARRTDITPEAFGFAVEDTPDGPSYRWL